jgi:hypothetical protein
MINDLATDDIDDGFDGADEEVDDNEEVETGESSDNVGDPSVEINVEDLISELEAEGLTSNLGKEQGTRKRLEELMDRKRAMRDLEDFDDYDI